MRQVIVDILDHTFGLGFIDELRVTGETDKTLIETMDENQRVIIKGTLANPLPELNGEFGVKQLQKFKGLAEHPNFRGDEASIEIVTQVRNDEDVPEKAVFTGNDGKSKFEHRFCSPNHVQEQYDFMGAPWNVTMTLGKSVINEFQSFASIYGDETLFTVRTVDGELRFYIGEDGGGYITVPTDEEVNFSNELRWPMAEVLSVLKLDEKDAEISIFDDPRAAALQVKINTKEAEWLYIFPLVRA